MTNIVYVRQRSESKNVAEFRTGGFSYAKRTPLDQLQGREESEEVDVTQQFAVPNRSVGTSVATLPRRCSIKCARQLVGHKMEGQTNALDNLCDPLDLVVSRDRFELHARRFYSPAARDSAGGVAH